MLSVAGGTVDVASELGAKLRAGSYDAVVGIGGGRTIDTVKYAASQHGLPMVAVATSLAHDGIASPVSVSTVTAPHLLRGAHTVRGVGGPRLRGPQPRPSDPVRHRRRAEQPVRGRGLGTGRARAREPVDGLALALARTGATAVLNHGGDITDEDFLATLANALVLGGVAMGVAGPASLQRRVPRDRPRDHRAASRVGTHGEQVALGALFCTFLRDDTELFHLLRAAFRGTACHDTGGARPRRRRVRPGG